MTERQRAVLLMQARAELDYILTRPPSRWAGRLVELVEDRIGALRAARTTG